ncbi:hypothetical protein AZH53_02225 [Methanomicrobiaceae archaeon CYW5]|uniref:metal-dependent hydrolase n=1 Tax=Methanovulcanius yangii TaxID=1789227 RepID=UPI0029C9BABE|nr:metal-dependent hydrolase [Methanovulcanius yangii]MBT8507246.1 hypothetical protein [Methanovulcanius yangii]
MAYLVPFAVLGAVIPDIDVVFELLPDDNPSSYIFSHGGITHSLAGAVVISLIAFAAIFVLSRFMGIGGGISENASTFVLLAIMGGAILHVLLDYLAYPGIPLLYPFSAEKMTAGIFAGPNPFLLLISLILLVLILIKKVGNQHIIAYMVLILVVILLSAGMKCYVSFQTDGETVPGMNPLNWTIIKEDDVSYTIQAYHLFDGVTGEKRYEKYTNITPREASRYWDVPEVRRLRYYSYITTIEKSTDGITFCDPLRESGIFLYPTKHVTYSMPEFVEYSAGS